MRRRLTELNSRDCASSSVCSLLTPVSAANSFVYRGAVQPRPEQYIRQVTGDDDQHE